MKALGLWLLRNLEPKPLVQRYQWEKPGDMIHVDTKQLARFERGGHRITGDRVKAARGALATRRATWRWMTPLDGPMWKCCPMSRRRQRSASWPVPWSGSTSRESPAVLCSRTTDLRIRSSDLRKACRNLDLKSVFTKPTTLRTNAKA
jgi:hypothetical protein